MVLRNVLGRNAVIMATVTFLRGRQVLAVVELVKVPARVI